MAKERKKSLVGWMSPNFVLEWDKACQHRIHMWAIYKRKKEYPLQPSFKPVKVRITIEEIK